MTDKKTEQQEAAYNAWLNDYATSAGLKANADATKNNDSSIRAKAFSSLEDMITKSGITNSIDPKTISDRGLESMATQYSADLTKSADQLFKDGYESIVDRALKGKEEDLAKKIFGLNPGKAKVKGFEETLKYHALLNNLKNYATMDREEFVENISKAKKEIIESATKLYSETLNKTGLTELQIKARVNFAKTAFSYANPNEIRAIAGEYVQVAGKAMSDSLEGKDITKYASEIIKAKAKDKKTISEAQRDLYLISAQ